MARRRGRVGSSPAWDSPAATIGGRVRNVRPDGRVRVRCLGADARERLRRGRRYPTPAMPVPAGRSGGRQSRRLRFTGWGESRGQLVAELLMTDFGRCVRRCGEAVLLLSLFVAPAAAGQTRASADEAYAPPRTSDGHPDLQGIWQALNTAAWDLEDHSGSRGIPAGQGVVVGRRDPLPAVGPGAEAAELREPRDGRPRDPVHHAGGAAHHLHAVSRSRFSSSPIGC